ncbi:MAG TPA: hypothetical protein VK174_03285 [Chitinophagales bacterium]|nr:hypothetical protein [Chitinophagales bacterium]
MTPTSINDYFKVLCITVLLITGYFSHAQNGVKIAATAGTADPSAMLDITSSNKGLLFPRVTLTGLTDNTTPVNNPATGLVVYNLGSVGVPATGIYFWNGTSWVLLSSGGLSGSGTTNQISKWTASNALGNSIVTDNGTNVGIGNSSPGQKLDVVGNIAVSGSAGNSIYTYTNSDANWRIGMSDLTANVGFSRVLATSHVQYATFANGAGQGFAVGDKVSGLSAFEVTSSASGYAAYFRGSIRSAPLAGTGYRIVYADANGVLTPASSITFTSTAQADAMGLPTGTYTFNFPGSTGAQQLYYQSNMNNGQGYVRVFSSPYNGTATVNWVGNSFPFTKFLVQTDGSTGTQTRATAFFSTARLFNADNQLGVSTGGTHTGYRVFIGYAGGMGIYNNTQQVCNWGNSSGSVGAGFNGSTCGTYPNGLLWGTGTGTATYTAISTTWEVWIAN